MKGLHLTADLYRCRCDPAWLTDAARLGQWCLAAIESVGLQPVQHVVHAFPADAQGPAHVTAAVLLAGSHVCVHTWPEERAVTCDVHVVHLGGDRSAPARELMAALVQRFEPEWTEQRSLDRGEEN
ncbi:MAG TPA: S-adenosylmethionine decarboxylase [Ramlibacter sp.]|uniref:S-adenosylmethionine decarboxylase family protein n=1 Tax=Ramlibacter sp. TaxID=1917967 RepID=UPI002D810A45|nr:S-adenosylmethionine decarboxylase [Ramlibacter sp.]HET8744738.1 S-adenosylmethionine decarboxylase [Ramlibacter sp.]